MQVDSKAGGQRQTPGYHPHESHCQHLEINKLLTSPNQPAGNERQQHLTVLRTTMIFTFPAKTRKKRKENLEENHNKDKPKDVERLKKEKPAGKWWRG